MSLDVVRSPALTPTLFQGTECTHPSTCRTPFPPLPRLRVRAAPPNFFQQRVEKDVLLFNFATCVIKEAWDARTAAIWNETRRADLPPSSGSVIYNCAPCLESNEPTRRPTFR
jgi:hypothetical protein